MVGRFDERFLEEIKSRLRPSDVIGRSVKLRKQGREYVATEPVGAERVRPAAALLPHRRPEAQAQGLLVGIGRAQERREDSDQDEHADDRERHDRGPSPSWRRLRLDLGVGQRENAAHRAYRMRGSMSA